MWNRRQLKEIGKVRFKGNYWRAVLVALLLVFIAGGSGRINYHLNTKPVSIQHSTEYFYDSPDMFPADNLDVQNIDDLLDQDVTPQIKNFVKNYSYWLGPLAALVGISITLAMAMGLIFKIFVANPLCVGCKKFFLNNLEEEAALGRLGDGFAINYLDNVKTMFFRDLYNFLWFLLFVIPGFIKAYEYRMIPYIIAQYPDITTKDAFAMSKSMMKGNKWDTFVLDLSFIGWHILSSITMGLLGVLYVNPYLAQTDAALYDALQPKHGYEEDVTMNYF